MTPEFKQRWITALTDGSFIRTTALLREAGEEGSQDQLELAKFNDKHCCLGVAAALMGFDLITKRRDEILSTEELAVLGLSYDDQLELAKFNDKGTVNHGCFYPNEVIEKIKKLTEVIWPEFYHEMDNALIGTMGPYEYDADTVDYSYVVTPPPKL